LTFGRRYLGRSCMLFMKGTSTHGCEYRITFVPMRRYHIGAVYFRPQTLMNHCDIGPRIQEIMLLELTPFRFITLQFCNILEESLGSVIRWTYGVWKNDAIHTLLLLFLASSPWQLNR